MNLLNDFNFYDNIKLAERIENYLNYENSSTPSLSLTTARQNSEPETAKFEFNFFKLTKILLVDESLIENELDLNTVLKYCLNKSIEQYNLFQAQNQPNETSFCDDECDENDDLNIIELMSNFKLNLLNLMHRFREIFKRLNCYEPTKKKMTYYDYMSAFVSIYLDISIELEVKINHSKLTNIRNDHLNEQELCTNTFYLLDSCVYYVCNALLQLKHFKNSKLDFLFPIFQKIVDLKSKPHQGTKIKEKPTICKSLFMRYLLIYCMLRSSTTDLDKIKFFKKFINSYKIPFQIKEFTVKLITSYFSSNTSNHLCTILNELDSDKKLRNYFVKHLNEVYVQLFVTALHNKSLNLKSNHESMSPILNNSELDFIQVDKDFNSSSSIVEEDLEVDEPEYELEFTSDFSELTQYDVNSIVDSNEPVNILNTPLKSNEKLGLKTQVVLERLDLTSFTRLPNSSYSTKTPEQIRNETRLASLSKRYEEISRRKSPTRENISKLNLFRNIYEEENALNGDYRYNYNFDNNGYFEYSQAKFYKLNDLVSIMINTNEEKPSSLSKNLPNDLASIYNDCNKSIISNINSLTSSSLVINENPKEVLNDIELAKSEFKRRKRDFLEKNAKAYQMSQSIPKKKKHKKVKNKPRTSNSISLAKYGLRNRLPNVWYYD